MGPVAFFGLMAAAAALSLVVAPELVGLAVLGLGLVLVLFAMSGSPWIGAAAVLFAGLGLLELLAGEEARDADPGSGRRAWWSVARGLGAAEAALAAAAVATFASVI